MKLANVFGSKDPYSVRKAGDHWEVMVKTKEKLYRAAKLYFNERSEHSRLVITATGTDNSLVMEILAVLDKNIKDFRMDSISIDDYDMESAMKDLIVKLSDELSEDTLEKLLGKDPRLSEAYDWAHPAEER